MHSEFFTPAQSEFVLVSLDFPQGEEAKAAVPNPKRNEELMGKYGVRGFPTVMIVEADGTALGQTGYRDMDPADYLADVKKIRDAGRKALSAIREIEAEYASAEDKLAVANKACELLGEMSSESPGVSVLADILRESMKLTDKAKVQIKFLSAIMSSTAPTAADREMAEKLDPKNENGLLFKLLMVKMNNLSSIEDVADFGVQAEAVWATGNVEASEDSLTVMVSCAFFYKEYLSDADLAKTWAERAVAQGGLDERMQEVIDSILAE